MCLVVKKNHILIAAVLTLVALFSVILTAAAHVEVPSNSVVVALDAGHGDADGGASGVTTGVKESEINMKIINYLREYFNNVGIKTILTRDGEGIFDGRFNKQKDMEERKRIIEESNCNMMISVHLNKFSDPSVRGAQAFYYPGNAEGKMLATDIQNSLNKNITPNKMRNAFARDYFMLRITVAASVIVECGFLSSPEDERLLLTAAHQEKLAHAIFFGTMAYLSATAVQQFLP